jgi:hypothetical protein
MATRAAFYAKANSVRGDAGLDPVNMPLGIVTSDASTQINSVSDNGNLPNYDGPNERLRIQAMIYQPELYQKMNLHPTVRARDQEYLQKYLAAKESTGSLTIDPSPSDEI